MRVANCNLHGPSTRSGITGMIEKVELKQYVSCTSPKRNLHNWLEAGGLSLGPIMLEAAMALAHPQLYQVTVLQQSYIPGEGSIPLIG